MKKFFSLRKVILLLLILILVSAGVFYFTREKPEPGVSANTIELESKTLEQIISVKAPLEGIEKAEVSSPLNYEIIDIRVKEGDIVSKNQILAVLDSDELQKGIASAESQIELSNLEQQERLRQSQIEYDKSLFRLEKLEKDYAQKLELYENGISPKEDLTGIETELEELKKSIENYQAVDHVISLNESEIKRLEIQKQELRQKKGDLEKIYIKSPIDGTVTRVNVNLGRYANDTENAKSMFVIENLEKLQMKVSISEFDIGSIEIGQEALVYADLLGQDFAKGSITRISPTAEQKDNNNMERVIPVLIDITEKPDTLIAGVISTAKILVNKSENTYAVPAGALVQGEDSEYKIFKVNEDQTIQSIPVKIGLETDLETEIISSELLDGMKVVVNPNETFVEGMLIIPNEDEMNQ